MINQLGKEIHEWAKGKGFWGDGTYYVGFNSAEFMLCKLMLLTTEVAEAAEAVRVGDYENFKEELADIAIRLFDLAHATGVDLEEAIRVKMEINKLRPRMHGKRA